MVVQVDLNTRLSLLQDPESGKLLGWIPYLRRRRLEPRRLSGLTVFHCPAPRLVITDHGPTSATANGNRTKGREQI
eukprot:683386-Heterocapsa_arctica.AAC.1